MRDVDAFAVVWYGNYLTFCDEARAELLRAFGLSPAWFLELGYHAVVVECRSRYRAPARFDDEIDVHTRVRPPRGSRLSFAFTIRRTADGVLLAEVETDLVIVRPSGELVYLLPAPLEAPLERLLAAQPAEEP
jgi:acyl-CoA thioester hydrolase